MSNYRKLVAAVVGMALLFLERRLGISAPGLEEPLIELAMSAATALAVWWFPNGGKGAPPSLNGVPQG